VSDNSTTGAQKPVYYAALNGWRGLLALAIVMYHTIWMSHPQATAFFDNLPLLIDVFFVFSGFLLFALYQDRLQTTGEVKDFLSRRLARLYPVHFVMLIVAFLYALARVLAQYLGYARLEPGEILPFEPGATETWQSFLSNLSLTQAMGLHDHLSFNNPAWTVSVLFWSYVVFAGLMLWARPKKTWHFGLIAVFTGLNYFVLSRLKPDMDFHYDLGFFRALGGFFTGVLAAWSYQKLAPILKHPGRARASVLELAALAALLSFEIYCTGKLQFFVAPILFVFVIIFAADAGYVSKILRARAIGYLGRISYSLYMVHFVIALVFGIAARKVLPQVFGPDWNDQYWGGDLWLLVYLLTVLIAAHLLYTFVELPGRKAVLNFRFKQLSLPFFTSRKSGKT